MIRYPIRIARRDDDDVGCSKSWARNALCTCLPRCLYLGASMSAASTPVDRIKNQAQHAMHDASPWIVRAGRFGLASKGVVYAIVGWLALQAARHGQQPTDQRGALHNLLHQRFGTVLLGFLCVGLIAYMVWRLVQAMTNPENEPNDLKGWSTRAFRLGSGLIYGGLGIAAARLLVGMSTEHRTPSDWTAMLMRQPFGKWLVVAAGLCVSAYGAMRIYNAWNGVLKKQLVLDKYAAGVREWIVGIGRFGQAARGVVFVVMGGFVFFAGLHVNPDEAKGVADALKSIERAPYGPYLLVAVSLGLIAYGIFQFIEARYRRIRAQ
jgi:hypothetical protein